MDRTTNPAKRALVISQSPLARDPRVMREIDWLTAGSWTVDSLGLGEKPIEQMRDHFSMTDMPRWARPKLAKALIHLLLPYAARFRIFSLSRIPKELSARIRHGEYDLVVFNDIHLIPWIADTSTFTQTSASGHIHLDLHEYHPATLPSGSPWRSLVGGYYSWTRRFIGANRFDTRSTVARGIADLYANDFNISLPTIVHNSPAYVEQSPGEVNPKRIKLVHHGLAGQKRGLPQLIDTVRLLDDRFHLTLMLTGSEDMIIELKEMSADIAERVAIVPAVPMSEITTAINTFDIEVMFFPPVTESLRLALPNKFFEGIQGRLAIVTGPSPMMAEIIEEYSNGVVADGWAVEDLAAALDSLTVDQIMAMKLASHRAALDLSAEHERESFFRAIRRI